MNGMEIPMQDDPLEDAQATIECGCIRIGPKFHHKEDIEDPNVKCGCDGDEKCPLTVMLDVSNEALQSKNGKKSKKFKKY